MDKRLEVIGTTPGDPYRYLALAVLGLAIRDASRWGRHALDARKFLRGEWCAFLADVLDVAGYLDRAVAELPVTGSGDAAE